MAAKKETPKMGAHVLASAAQRSDVMWVRQQSERLAGELEKQAARLRDGAAAFDRALAEAAHA
jgi:hypothetical protein